MQILSIFLAFLTVNNIVDANGKLLDTSRTLLARQKRTLIFQPGLNWIQMIVGIGLPIELKDQSITWGAAFKSYYRVPNNSSDFTRPTITVARRGRNAIGRWQLYDAFIRLLERFGQDDTRACLLRAICEVAAMPFDERSGLLAEILHVILRPSSTTEFIDDHANVEYKAAEELGKQRRRRRRDDDDDDDGCRLVFPDCKSDIFNKFMR